MGNKLAFLFFFLSIIFINQNVFACPPNSKSIDGTTAAVQGCKCDNSDTVIPNDPDYNGPPCPGPLVVVKCPDNSKQILQTRSGNLTCKCDNDAKKQVFVQSNGQVTGTCPSAPTVVTERCDDYSDTITVEWDMDTDQPKDPPDGYGYNVAICRCKFSDGRYKLENAASNRNTCPREEQRTAANTTQSVSCIQDLENQIRKCSLQAEETMNTCSDKEESNSKVKGVVNGISSQIAALQGNGGADSCRKAGFLSSTAAYGVGMIRQDCEKEITACENSCNDLLKYTEVAQIENHCRQAASPAELASITAPGAAREQFLAKAKELSESMATAESDCASHQKQTNAEKFLEKAKLAAQGYVNSNIQATKCDAMLSGKAEINPISLACALAGGGANCPINCITNPGDVSCKVINTQGPAQIALPGNLKPAPGNNIVGGLKNTKGDLGNLDLSGGSGDGAATGTLPPAGDNSSGVFGTAAAAPGGSTGSTGEGPGKEGKDKAGAESTEEKGFLGGTFAAMKNAASNFFGGGSSRSSSTKNSIGQNSKNTSELNKKNSMIRGVANAGQKCYYDAKGAEYCFGRPNMDIFKMINIRYNFQANSFIKGGG